jgi:hypothetical protein
MVSKIIIRNDIDFIYKNITDKEQILNELKNIFSKYYSNSDIEYVSVNEQIERINKNIKTKTLSLDCWYKGDYNFRCSRLFNLFDKQEKAISLVYQNIPIISEFVTIVDDDVSTGFTFNKTIELLNIKHYSTYTMVEEQNISYDVIDIRDFIFGSENGGLMTQYGRFPYVYPYVNLQTRASVEKQNIKNISKDIFKLNLEIFKTNNINQNITNQLLLVEKTKNLNQIYKKYYE